MKSDYSKESITEFLSRKYGEDIRLFPIKEGQESQAYWFSRGGREYVVRINSNMESFKKDKYAYEHFRSDRVPIPEVVETGSFDGTHYFCISVKADGITYEDSDEETVVRLLGDITDVTEPIYQALPAAACLTAIRETLRFTAGENILRRYSRETGRR